MKATDALKLSIKNSELKKVYREIEAAAKRGEREITIDNNDIIVDILREDGYRVNSVGDGDYESHTVNYIVKW